MALKVSETKNISRLPSSGIVPPAMLMEERCELLVVVAYGVDVVLVFPFYNSLIYIYIFFFFSNCVVNDVGVRNKGF